MADRPTNACFVNEARHDGPVGIAVSELRYVPGSLRAAREICAKLMRENFRYILYVLDHISQPQS